jgi:FkbM family methyltransferase
MQNRNILYSIESIPNKSKIAIYGSGKIGLGFGLNVKKIRSDIEISFFINSFKSGNLSGIPVIKIDDIDKYGNEIDLIIIASSEWDPIEDLLLKKNIPFFIISNELMYNTLEISSLGSFRFNEVVLDTMYDRLNKILSYFDEEDKYLFELLMQLRLTQDESAVFNFLKTAKHKFAIPYLDYLDKNFDGDVILEGGVSDGRDSINFYNYFENKNLKLFGFEPFIEAFESSPNKEELITRGGQVLPFALWNEDQLIRFNKNLNSASTSSVVRDFDESGSEKFIEIKGCKIDSFVKENDIKSVCLFKLDIEGAELEALIGAREMIAKYKPQLAISIYHKKEHLYEIPELLKELNPAYKFKLGFYTPTFIDTVLYAIPV